MNSINLDEYIASIRTQGERDSEGQFTVSGIQARAKLAESVPPAMADPWLALTRLVEGLSLGFGLEASHLGFFVIDSSFIWVNKAGLEFFVPQSDSARPLGELAEMLKRVEEQPFSGTEPAEILLSRSLLTFTKLGVACYFNFGGHEVSWPHSDVDAETMTILKKQSSSLGASIKIVFSEHPAWTAYANLERSRRPNLFHALDPHRCLTKTRMWDDEGVGRDVLDTFGDWHRGSWYDYRTRPAVLVESFHHGPADSPMRVSGKIQLNPGNSTRVDSDLSAWDRFLGRRRFVFLRHWGESLPEVKQSHHGRVPVRAIFAVGLSDIVSKARFFHWGRVPNDVVLEGMPQGLFALVWWPELQQNLYGTDWVRDAAFEEALAWTHQQAQECFARLKDELLYVRDLVKTEHSRKGYVDLVDERLIEWLGQDLSASHAASGDS